MTSAPGPVFQHLTIADGVRAAAQRSPAKTAVVDGDRRLSYGDLVQRMDRVSSQLGSDLGLRPKDFAALLSINCAEYVEVVLGAAQSGVPIVHMSPKAAPEEIEFICADAEVKALFVHHSLGEAVRQLHLPTVEHVIVLESAAYEAWLSRGDPRAPRVDIAEWDTFCVFYTSGTTGRPKAVLLPHRSRVLNMLCMASEYGCYSSEDHSLAIAPMAHGAGLTFSLAPIFFGGTTTLHRSFDPQAVMAELRRGEITNVFVVPTHVQALFALTPEQRGPRPDSLRRIISNAAPLSYALKEKVVGFFGEGLLFECYGSTEAGIVTNLAPDDQLRKPGSVGRPFPLTLVRIVDENGADVQDGEVGELISSSPALFNGYLHVPLEETPGLRDGWFGAGDLARRDSEGYIFIVGRRDDKIITGGLNVYPREVEESLMLHPAVLDAAVFAVPDERWGEALHAAVTLVQGTPVTVDQLKDHCRMILARYKVPKVITVLPLLPRNAGGKILRRELPVLTGTGGAHDHA